MGQGSCGTLDTSPRLPPTAHPRWQQLWPRLDGWCKGLFLFVHFAFPRKYDCSWLQREASIQLPQEPGEGRGAGGEFLGSGPQLRSRQGKKVAGGIWEGSLLSVLLPQPNLCIVVGTAGLGGGGGAPSRFHYVSLSACSRASGLRVQGDPRRFSTHPINRHF